MKSLGTMVNSVDGAASDARKKPVCARARMLRPDPQGGTMSSFLSRVLPLALFGLASACGTDTFVASDGGADASQDTIFDNAAPDAGLNCTAPMANCSGNPADGCNIDLSSDNANCGGCGNVCNTQCAGGACPLVSQDSGVPQTVGDFACLTVDSSNVYWGTGLGAANGGGVWKVPLNGGNATLLAGQQDRPHSMASDGTNLYFANFGTGGTTGSIQRIAINGGTPAPTPIAINQASPLDVAVDATDVYWTNSGDGSVWKSDKTIPNPVNVVPASGVNHARFLRLDATDVFYTDGAGNTVFRVAKSGGAPVAMSAIPAASHLAIDSATAYVGSGGSGSLAILSVALSATNGASQQIMTNLESLGGIETDGTNVWYALPSNVYPFQANTGEIHRMTVAGQGDVTLVSKQNNPGCIALDATSVYWISQGNGMVSKTGK
jgi:hypothetical protein